MLLVFKWTRIWNAGNWLSLMQSTCDVCWGSQNLNKQRRVPLKKTLTLCSSELHKLTSLQLQTYYTFIQFSTEHHSVYTQLVRVTNHWGREAKLSWWKQKWIFSQDFFACSDLQASGGRILVSMTNVFPLSLKGNVTMLICIFIVSCSRSVVSLKLICRDFVVHLLSLRRWQMDNRKTMDRLFASICLFELNVSLYKSYPPNTHL